MTQNFMIDCSLIYFYAIIMIFIRATEPKYNHNLTIWFIMHIGQSVSQLKWKCLEIWSLIKTVYSIHFLSLFISKRHFFGVVHRLPLIIINENPNILYIYVCVNNDILIPLSIFRKLTEACMSARFILLIFSLSFFFHFVGYLLLPEIKSKYIHRIFIFLFLLWYHIL